MSQALVGIVMGSESDLETMRHAAQQLEALGVPYELRVLSAHRTPEQTAEWARTAVDRGLRVLIAAAGGAAHLAGVVSGLTPLPVLGVPMPSAHLQGLDSLLSTVQMPGGVPTASFAIGKPGAVNAALFAARILALDDQKLRAQLEAHREAQAARVLESDKRVSKASKG